MSLAKRSEAVCRGGCIISGRFFLGLATVVVLHGLFMAAGGCGRHEDSAGTQPAVRIPLGGEVAGVGETDSTTPKSEVAVVRAEVPEPTSAPAAHAATWGSLNARFVYDGDPPGRSPLTITADIDFCGKQNILAEDLIVHPQDRGVANVVAWLYHPPGEAIPPVHPSYSSASEAEVDLDVGCLFKPHVCFLRTSQTLRIRNRNPIGDSAKIDLFNNSPINIMLASDSEMRFQITRPERLPARMSCSVHPWESGWLVVNAHPYAAKSDESGRLRIENLPAGKRILQFWHEKAGPLTNVEQDGRPITWRRGRMEIEIGAGENDLGDIVLQPSLFAG